VSTIDLLLGIIDRAYNRRSWHGTNLRGSVRGVTVDDATWRPGRGRHNIWEIVVHAAYWKYVVRRRLAGEPRGSFVLKGSNWFTRPAPREASEAAWRKDVQLLDDVHRALRQTIEKLDDKRLDATDAGGTVSAFDLIAGIAAHDLYHAGQIQLLKRLQQARLTSR
jgi:hypothetical protein